MASNEGASGRTLAHLVSYMSDSDDERPQDEEEEEEDGEREEEGVKEMEVEMKDEEEEEEHEEVFEATESKPILQPSTSSSNLLKSLVSYGADDEKKKGRKTGLVSYAGEEDDGRGPEEGGIDDEYDHEKSWTENQSSPIDEIEDQIKLENLVESAELTASMSLPESALSQKIRRLSADEVKLPPEPTGRCPRHLQEKINKNYERKLNLNQVIQRRKDFRNPSIYEKLINYLGIDELGTNYPKDMYDPYCWEESSYFESLAKAQRDEIQKKKEKDKKEKTKVEFVTGMARKPQVQAPQITSTTGVPPLMPTTQTTGQGDEKKRKSKWDNPAPMPQPVPLMQRPLISLVSTTIIPSTVVSTTTSATGTKTTVISSIGTIKKPKLEK